MVVPNSGPDQPPPKDPHDYSRCGNAAPVYRDDDSPTCEIRAALNRATGVTHRFGGIRYALRRRDRGSPPSKPANGSD